jgi:hypothetical protein
MSVCEEIIAARRFGVVHCGLSNVSGPTLTELASEFGLKPEESCYREIDRETARGVVRLVLQQDLAYDHQIISPKRAQELATRFIDQFGQSDVHFFTNGTFKSGPDRSHGEWNPVTEATFDTGVLAIGPHCSGCLWVEEED